MFVLQGKERIRIEDNSLSYKGELHNSIRNFVPSVTQFLLNTKKIELLEYCSIKMN